MPSARVRLDKWSTVAMSQETMSSPTGSIHHTPGAGAGEAFPNGAHSPQWKQLQRAWEGAGVAIHSSHIWKHTRWPMEVAVKSVRKRNEECWRKPQRAVWYLDLILHGCLPQLGTIWKSQIPFLITNFSFGHFSQKCVHEIYLGKKARNSLNARKSSQCTTQEAGMSTTSV